MTPGLPSGHPAITSSITEVCDTSQSAITVTPDSSTDADASQRPTSGGSNGLPHDTVSTRRATSPRVAAHRSRSGPDPDNLRAADPATPSSATAAANGGITP